jgi:Ureidoglycolate hydrolase
MREIKNITSKNFKDFGTIIEFPEGNTEEFIIVEKEESNPWRLAVFRYQKKEISTIECHPTSKESFEPLSGVTVLVVANNDNPAGYEAFLLDKPVCLKKGVWHQVLALSAEAQVKITENLEVESEFYELDKPIKVQIG